MPYGPSTRTAQDVMLQVKRAFGDESGVQLEDADLYRWMNDAQDEINRQNRILKATSTANSVAGQAGYSLPSVGILSIESLHYDGRRLPNVPFAQAELDIIAKGSTTDQGTPEIWYEWGGLLSFWPVPSTVAPFTIYYTAKPPRLTLATDLLAVPDKYYSAVVQYVLQQAYEMDEDWQASQTKGQQFNEGLVTLADEERTAQHMNYQIVTLVD